MASILTLGITSAIVYYDNINKKNEIVLAESLMDPATMNDKMVDNEITSTPEVEVKEERIEVYEGMTYDELVEKLNRTLSSDLTNMGYAYATYSLELGVDPYLAVAISMHETGCRHVIMSEDKKVKDVVVIEPMILLKKVYMVL